ncbi:LexA family protein [Streptomyces sp. NPDC127110]|uniref:LexA family protein n=1 Tax=Streptomyces sp. NPDC127110 TaxID=3345362 RepID=UPI0036447240
MIQLTYTQRRIITAIDRHLADHGDGPTIREIGAEVGLSSTSSVALQLTRLEERGVLARGGRSWRTARLTEAAEERLAGRTRHR